MDKVVSNKSSSLLKNILQNTQTLQIFMMIIKTKSIYKRNLKSCRAWVKRPSGLSKREEMKYKLWKQVLI